MATRKKQVDRVRMTYEIQITRPLQDAVQDPIDLWDELQYTVGRNALLNVTLKKTEALPAPTTSASS